MALVRARDDGCVRCGVNSGLTTQHRVSRGMGGSKHRPFVNEPANLITLCGSGTTGCHGWVEHHPLDAQDAGWALSRWVTRPDEFPVLYHDGRFYSLDNEGARTGASGHRCGSLGGGSPAVHDPAVEDPWPADPDWAGWSP